MSKRNALYKRHRISRRQFLTGSTAVLAGALMPSGVRALAASVDKGAPLAAGHRTLGRAVASGPIIADHTVVDRCADIPQAYIDEVKKMWLDVPGESHSSGYRRGCLLLESQDSKYAVNVLDYGTPEAYTDQHLRVSPIAWGDLTHPTGWRTSHGEEDFFTSAQAIQQIKDHLTYANTNGPEIAAFGFGWCWDMTWHNGSGGTVDPVYQVRWAGSSVGGPDGDLRWGLDAEDYALTGNHVCMDTYLNAVEEYITHCETNGYSTVPFFTTGPVDGASGERGYQRHLKHEHIRNYVLASSDLMLFDYADILSWSNAGQQNLESWTDYGGTPQQYQMIHPDNMLDLDGTYTEDGDHIGERGALRLAKALWWMLARIAGWEPEGPAAPTGLIATPVSFMQVDLAWTASTDPNTVDYVIYRDGAQVGTSSTTDYSDMGVGPNRGYTYTVASRDGVGQVGSPCSPAFATTPAAPYSVSLPLVSKP